jgi:hypothetical protein
MILVQLPSYPKNRQLRSEAIIFLNSSIYLRISSDKRSLYRTLCMYHSFTILTNTAILIVISVSVLLRSRKFMAYQYLHEFLLPV